MQHLNDSAPHDTHDPYAIDDALYPWLLARPGATARVERVGDLVVAEHGGERAVWRIHPEDLATADETIQRAVAECRELQQQEQPS